MSDETLTARLADAERECGRLRGLADERGAAVAKLSGLLDDTMAALTEQLAYRRRLAEALAWYGEPIHWVEDSGHVFSDADLDGGERARKALEGR